MMKRLVLALSAIFLISAPAPVWAAEKDKESKSRYALLSPSESKRQQLTAPAEGVKLGYELGRGLHVSTEDDKYSLNFSTSMSVGYGYLWNEGVRQSNESGFAVNDIGVNLNGNFFNPKFGYFMGLGLYPNVYGYGGFSYQHAPWLGLQMGRIGIPYCGQASLAGRFGEVNGPVAPGHFCVGGDVGIKAYGSATSWLRYGAYVFNGEGNTNANEEVVFGGSLSARILKGDATRKRRIAKPDVRIGTGVMYDTGNERERTTNRPNDILRGNLSLGVGFWGFFADVDGYYLRNMTLYKTDIGFKTKVGTVIIPKRLDFAVHYSGVIPGKAGTAMPMTKGINIPIYDIAYTLNYYVFGGSEFMLSAGFQTLYNKDGIQNLNDNSFATNLTVSF
jgi:hypothetical protein